MLRKIFLAMLLIAMMSGVARAEEKTITFAADCTWPPMELLNENKEITGFAPELLDAMGKAAGFKAMVKNTAWDGIFAGLEAGKYDAISSSVSITEERKKTMDFSDPYFEVKQAVVIQKGANIGSVQDLKDKQVGGQIGTTGFFAIKKIEGAKPKSYDEIGLAMEDLFNGRIEAAICDDPVAADYALQKKEYKEKLAIAFIIDTPEKEYYGWPVKKGDTKTLELINKALAEVKANGTYDALMSKWFGRQ